jgi:hypothetical protein
MRADVAFAAGFLEDARVATDEAKGLDPAWPAVAEMEGRLAAAVILPDLMLRTVPVEVDLNQNRAEKDGHRFFLTVALACASLALVAVVSLGHRAGLGPVGLVPGSLRSEAALAADPVVDAELETTVPAPSIPPPVAPPPVAPPPVAPPPAETLAVPTSGIAEPAVAKAPAVRDAATTAASAAANHVAAAVEAAHDTRPSKPIVSPSPPLNDAGMRSLQDTSAPTDDPVASLKPPPVEASLKPPAVEAAPLSAALPSSPSIPVSAPPATAPEPSPPSRSLTPEAIATVDARSAVRATLARYEAAYSGLNVSAARAVWPAVDERALAKAFDGLSSQRVELDRCDVSVAGATAKAICSGSAEWTPKVGGGHRRQNRQWVFELANAGGAWQIVRAEAK